MLGILVVLIFMVKLVKFVELIEAAVMERLVILFMAKVVRIGINIVMRIMMRIVVEKIMRIVINIVVKIVMWVMLSIANFLGEWPFVVTGIAARVTSMVDSLRAVMRSVVRAVVLVGPEFGETIVARVVVASGSLFLEGDRFMFFWMVSRGMTVAMLIIMFIMPFAGHVLAVINDSFSVFLALGPWVAKGSRLLKTMPLDGVSASVIGLH